MVRGIQRTGACVYVPCVCACAIPSGDPPWTHVCVCGSVAGGWFSLTWARWSGSAGAAGFKTGEGESWADGRTQGGRRRRGISPPPERTARLPTPWRRDGEHKSAQDNLALSKKREWKDHGDEEWATPGTPPPAADCDFSPRAHDTTPGKPPIKCYFWRHVAYLNLRSWLLPVVQSVFLITAVWIQAIMESLHTVCSLFVLSSYMALCPPVVSVRCCLLSHAARALL